MLLRSIFAVVLFTFTFPAISNAQYRFEKYQPLVQRSNRILGIWHGQGRHWRTPGHDSTYYNPWSAHNSGLVSQGHEYQPNGGQLYYQPQTLPQESYYPTQPPTQYPSIAPLGGSYSPFGDEDVDEKVPEIDPVDGKRLPDLEDLPLPQEDQSQFNFSNDIYNHSTQKRVPQPSKSASIIEWTEIK